MRSSYSQSTSRRSVHVFADRLPLVRFGSRQNARVCEAVLPHASASLARNNSCSLSFRKIPCKRSPRLRAWRVAPKQSSYSFVPFTNSQSRSCAAPSRTLARRRSKRSFCCGETSIRSKRSRKPSQMASLICIFWSIGSALTSSVVVEQRCRSPGAPASFISASNAAPHRTAGSTAQVW